MREKFGRVKYTISILKSVLHKRTHLRSTQRENKTTRFPDITEIPKETLKWVNFKNLEPTAERTIGFPPTAENAVHPSFPLDTAAHLTFPYRSGSSEQRIPLLTTSYPSRIP